MGSIHPVERFFPSLVVVGILLAAVVLWIFAGLWYGLGACLLLAPEATLAVRAALRRSDG